MTRPTLLQRVVMTAAMTAASARVAVHNGEMVVTGGNWLTRRLLRRRTRAEILWPRKLLMYEPVVYGPSSKDLELWHAVALFNEGRLTSAARLKRTLEDIRQSFNGDRITVSRDATLHSGRNPL